MKRFLFGMVCIALSASTIAAEKFKEIDSKSFGDKWPLTFEHAKVSCVNSHYVFVYDIDTDERYPLSGMAKNAVKSGKMEGRDLKEVLKKDPKDPLDNADIGPVFSEAIELCE
ncbi:MULTISPECIES: DUF2511 domain-containing protein [Klebsiella]|uniref:DUF2511 domain-containing protein n=1 Tax=Klebsiella TaxID=570 RepID=UPI002780849A|nr:DUF2511 domain-containing protein [Klebsiella variicola]ELD1739160.1 DUF2511 domain-containing protein [Escherichia coli]HCD4280718.1 DUF2511 domain-containing protein [Klebsiella pneumoniae]HDS9648221.1 DUF2511 domain-containing protein [Klebsiella pneumoniae subsp. pneumoniae]MCA7329456.1 YebY family protein [Escherichia coli]HCD6160570.1 DUF2511 domain-containing protein [Klebsiella pneumoniae]